ncbi:MAG: hypothetical protein ACLUE1_00865 [Adlercreutzia equolifaciens]
MNAHREVLCERPREAVQMKGQDVTVGVELEGTAYVYARSVRGIGGLPVGSSGRWCAFVLGHRLARGHLAHGSPRGRAHRRTSGRPRPPASGTWWTTSRTCSSAPAARALPWCPRRLPARDIPLPVLRVILYRPHVPRGRELARREAGRW